MQNVKDEQFLSLLGKQIRARRESQGLTQLDLGILCNNHAEQIGRIERGELNVTICSLLILAKALKMPLNELLDFNY